MLRWAVVFAILALIAGVLGFGGLQGDFAYIAKILLFVFVVLFVVSLIFGRTSGPVVSRIWRARAASRTGSAETAAQPVPFLLRTLGTILVVIRSRACLPSSAAQP